MLKLSLIFINASDSTDALSSKDDSKCSFWPQSPRPVRLPPAQLGPLLPSTGLVSEWTQLYLAEELALVTGPASGCILSTDMDLRPLNFFPLFIQIFHKFSKLYLMNFFITICYFLMLNLVICSPRHQHFYNACLNIYYNCEMVIILNRVHSDHY